MTYEVRYHFKNVSQKDEYFDHCADGGDGEDPELAKDIRLYIEIDELIFLELEANGTPRKNVTSLWETMNKFLDHVIDNIYPDYDYEKHIDMYTVDDSDNFMFREKIDNPKLTEHLLKFFNLDIDKIKEECDLTKIKEIHIDNYSASRKYIYFDTDLSKFTLLTFKNGNKVKKILQIQNIERIKDVFLNTLKYTDMTKILLPKNVIKKEKKNKYYV